MVRNRILVWVALACLTFTACLAGCGTTPKERLWQLNTWTESVRLTSDEATVQIGVLEQSIAETELVLNDSSLSESNKAEITEALTEFRSRLIAAQAAKIKADESLDTWQLEIDAILAEDNEEIGVGDELALYGEGVAVIGAAVPPPIGVWVTLAGSIMTIIGGLLGSRVQKRADAKIITKEKIAFTTVVNSVSSALNVLGNHATIDGTRAVELAKTAMSGIQKTTTSVDVESKVKDAIAQPLGS